MKIIFSPHYDGNVYVDSENRGNLLWDTLVTNEIGLLKELLLRAGLPQSVAEDSDNGIEERNNEWLEIMKKHPSPWINDSMTVAPKSVAKQVLDWRDRLLMEGWDDQKKYDSERLRSMAVWSRQLTKPGMADKWKEVQKWMADHSFENIEVEVNCPSGLLPKAVRSVIDQLPHTYNMERLDENLSASKYRVVAIDDVHEAYTWAAAQKFDDKALFVTSNPDRFDNVLMGIGGKDWNTGCLGVSLTAITPLDQLDAPDTLVWLDCMGSTENKRRLYFLMSGEKEEVGYDVKDDEQVKLEHDFLVTMLNRCPKVVLFSPKLSDGELAPVHQIVTELSTQSASSTVPMTSTQPVMHFKPQHEYRIDGDLLAKVSKKNLNMSQSSLSTLFQTPFDYVLENMLGLGVPENCDNDSLAVVKGEIAHKVLELIVNKYNSDFNIDYDNVFEEALAKVKEERVNCDELKYDGLRFNAFKDELKESLATLSQIIKDCKLKPVKSEKEILISPDLDGFANAKAYIDLVLETENGEYVIFDMKWSTSKKLYPEKLKKNESMQLEYYKHLLEADTERTVAWTAYYLFPLQTLFTTANITCDNVEVVKLKNPLEDLWQAMKDRRNQRLDEIENGLLEEGEGEDKNSFTVNGYPLSYNNNCKSGGFCNRKGRRDPKVTKHTILKNHLK